MTVINLKMQTWAVDEATWIFDYGGEQPPAIIEARLTRVVDKWESDADLPDFPKSGSSKRTLSKNLWLLARGDNDYATRYVDLTVEGDPLERRIHIILSGKSQCAFDSGSHLQFAHVGVYYYSGQEKVAHTEMNGYGWIGLDDVIPPLSQSLIWLLYPVEDLPVNAKYSSAHHMDILRWQSLKNTNGG